MEIINEKSLKDVSSSKLSHYKYLNQKISARHALNAYFKIETKIWSNS